MTWPTFACHTLTTHFAAGKLDVDRQVGAVLAPHRLDRQVVEIRVVVLGALAAIAVDGLHEVALPVEQADRDERQLEVARRLAVVAGEDAEAAGIDRQALVHAELGAEVGHQVLGAEAAGVLLERRFRVVRVEGRQYPGQGSRNAGSAAASIRRCSSMRLSIALGLWPTASHSAGFSLANSARVGRSQRVIKVRGDFLQARQALGNAGVDLEGIPGGGLHEARILPNQL